MEVLLWILGIAAVWIALALFFVLLVAGGRRSWRREKEAGQKRRDAQRTPTG